MAKGIMVVQTSPASPEREDEYNDWYSNKHIPEICSIPGFLGARRYKVHGAAPDGAHSYLAIYEVEADDLSAPMAALGEQSAAGKMAISDALGTDPAPVITIYEALD